MIRLLLILATITLFIAACGSILADYLSPQDPLRVADVIVAISGGDTEARVEEAVRLQELGWAPALLFSGAALDPESPSNAKVMKQRAVQLGIDETIISTEDNSQNTYQNAQFTLELLDDQDVESIILVTSPYHQRRAYEEFRYAFGEDVAIINHSANDVWSVGSWWQRPRSLYLTFSEAAKVALITIFR